MGISTASERNEALSGNRRLEPEQPPMGLLTTGWLASLRRKALRRHVWFKVLSKIDRGVIELTIKCVDTIRSAKLALVIGQIVCKVLKNFRSEFLENVKIAGQELAERISAIAVSWGYADASTWRSDHDFIRHLGTNAANETRGWNQF